jgi:hypothetical protein
MKTPVSSTAAPMRFVQQSCISSPPTIPIEINKLKVQILQNSFQNRVLKQVDRYMPPYNKLEQTHHYISHTAITVTLIRRVKVERLNKTHFHKRLCENLSAFHSAYKKAFSAAPFKANSKRQK